MSILSTDLAIYLKSQFDCSSIYQDIIQNIDYLYDKLINHEYFPINFDKLLDEYPIFPNQYNGIFKLYDIDPTTHKYKYQFNIVKIQNVALNDMHALTNNINESLLPLKVELNKYSSNIEKLIFDIRFQRLYYKFDYIDPNKVFLNQKHIQNYNYFYNVLGINPISLDCNIIENMILMIAINLIFFYNNTFYIDFNNYFLLDLNSTATIEDEFTNFINNNKTDIGNYLTKFVMNYIFKVLKPSDNIIELVQNHIIDNILPKLITSFSDFAVGYQKGKKIISSTILTYIRNYLSYFIYLDLVTSNTSFINDYTINRENISYIFEDEKLFNKYIDNVQKYNIQKYLNLSYLYKNSPLTYLNVLSKIILNFVDDSILPDSEMNLLIKQNFINSDISRIVDNLISIGFHQYLDIYTDTDKLLKLYNDNNIGELCIFQFTKTIMSDFIKSNEFNNFIITDFLEDVSIFLKDNILLSNDFNWYHDINLIKWGVQLLFDKYSPEIFKTFKTDIDSTMTEILKTKDQIIGEDLNNSTSGGNNYFESKYKISKELEHNVYINGTLIDPSQYFINETLVVFNFDPLTTDNITLDYYPYWIDFKYGEQSINSFLSNAKINKTIQEYISQLLKNIFKGSVTKSVFNKILKYYLI